MNTTTDKLHQKLLMQIIIGSAWVDQQLETSEINYLTKLLQRYGFAHDPDLQHLLTAPVPINQTELWMLEYLKDATADERQKALAAIAKVLITDDVVSDIEHDLLDDYYDMMAKIPPQADIPAVVESVGKFVRKTVRAIEDFVAEI